MKTSTRITKRLRELNVPYFANDNISEHVSASELKLIEQEVQEAVEDLLLTLLIDIDRDHNTQETARRLAHMFLHEVFAGRYHPRPSITEFPNAKKLGELYVTGPITVRSMCSHHFAPIVGRAWVGVIPGERVIGLSKFNRIAEWVLSRPQIQEEAVVQLADEIERLINPSGLAVIVKANHMCMTLRGVRESPDTMMTTSVMRGTLMTDVAARAEFLNLIDL